MPIIDAFTNNQTGVRVMTVQRRKRTMRVLRVREGSRHSEKLDRVSSAGGSSQRLQQDIAITKGREVRILFSGFHKIRHVL